MQFFDNKKLVFFTMNERSAKISLLIMEEMEIYQNFCMQKKKKKAVAAETNTLHDSFVTAAEALCLRIRFFPSMNYLSVFSPCS